MRTIWEAVESLNAKELRGYAARYLHRKAGVGMGEFISQERQRDYNLSVHPGLNEERVKNRKKVLEIYEAEKEELKKLGLFNPILDQLIKSAVGLREWGMEEERQVTNLMTLKPIR